MRSASGSGIQSDISADRGVESPGRGEKEGKLKSIGVSNMTPKIWKEYIPKFEMLPAVNQVECNPQLLSHPVVQRLAGNISISDFELTEEEMKEMRAMDTGKGTHDPEAPGVVLHPRRIFVEIGLFSELFKREVNDYIAVQKKINFCNI